MSAENDELQKAVQGIVRRELELSEGRMEAKMAGVIDDIRSEIRALRRSDEAIDSRLSITTKKVESMSELNQQMIQAGVEDALGKVFSFKRVMGLVGLGLGTLAAGIALAEKASAYL